LGKALILSQGATMKSLKKHALTATLAASLAFAGAGVVAQMNQSTDNPNQNPSFSSSQPSQAVSKKDLSYIRSAQRQLKSAKRVLQKDTSGVNERAIAAIDNALQELNTLQVPTNTGTYPQGGGGTSGTNSMTPGAGILMTPSMSDTPGMMPSGVTGTPGTSGY
jgi:hypothetical protein